MANIRLDAALAAIGAGIHIVAAPYTDISNQLIAAQATLGATGGKICIPAGIFYVQNVPLIDGIYYEGAGETVTQLKLPNGANNSMFVSSGDLFYGWGFADIYFSGIYNSQLYAPLGGPVCERSGLNCIDCRDSTNVYNGSITNCRFDYFNIAYRGANAAGTNFDPYVRLINCSFQQNNVACVFGEHLQLTSCFFFSNGTLTGSILTGGGALDGRINDCTVRNCWFLWNYSACNPAAINNSQFIGCGFFAQIYADLLLNSYNLISGCAFWGLSASRTFGIVIRRGVGNTIVGNKINEQGACYQGAFITTLDNGSPFLFSNTIVSNNQVYLLDNPAGAFIDFTSIGNGSSEVRGWVINGNSVATNRTQFLKCNSVYSSELTITGNVFNLTGDYFSGSPIALIQMYTAQGNTVVGNTFMDETISGRAIVFGGILGSTIIVANSFTHPNNSAFTVIQEGASAGSIKAQNNIGYMTRNSGVTSFIAATSALIEHGLARTPNIQDILLTPHGECAAPPYVSHVTSTQFSINLTSTTTVNIGWVASCSN